MTRPNVLLVTIDQWRADCLGVDGHPVVETPNVDRLAGEGVRFTNHWAQAAPCGPSRASLHTGLYAMNHRSVLNGTPLDARFPTSASLARDAGYDPVLFGYTDTTVDPRTVADDSDPRLRTYEGVLPGFRVGTLLPEHARPWLEWLRQQGHRDVPDSVWDLYGRAGPGVAAPYPAEHSEAAFLTERALAEIDQRAAPEGDPWFVHVSYLRPHPPWLAPAPWHDRYHPSDVPPMARAATRDAEASLHPLLGAVLGLPGVAAPADDEMRAIVATYYGMLGEVDSQLGVLLDGIRHRRLDDSTLVILTSDHGEQGGDHHLVEKLLWFDQSFHIPLIVRTPGGAAAGTVVDAFTENIDILPTLVDLCDLDAPPHLDGASLVPFLDGSGAPEGWRTEVHWEWDYRDPVMGLPEAVFGLRMDECCLAVVRNASSKYVHFGGHGNGMPSLFFDLAEDPHETVDLAGDPRYRDRMLEAAQHMLTWRLTHADTTLTGHAATPDGMVSRRDPPRPARPRR